MSQRSRYPDDATGRVLALMARNGLLVPTYEAVVAAENEVDAIGRRFGGFGDGFSSSGDVGHG